MGFKSAIQRGFQGKGGNAFKPFRNYVHGKNRAKGKKGGYAGGWAAIAFGNVVNAHSSAEELAIEFEMYTENNPYSPEAYEEA